MTAPVTWCECCGKQLAGGGDVCAGCRSLIARDEGDVMWCSGCGRIALKTGCRRCETRVHRTVLGTVAHGALCSCPRCDGAEAASATD